MAQKVIVAGASGYIGSRICQALCQNGYKVIAFVRSQSDKKTIDQWVTSYIEGDLQEKTCVPDIIDSIQKEKISYMIACVGAVNYHHHYDVSTSINVETTKNLIEITLALQQSDIFDKFIFIGSVASRGFLSLKPKPDAYIDETSDYYEKNISVYSDVKKEAENLVQKAIREQKLRAVIIEPGSLVGKSIGKKTTTSTGLINKIIKGFPVLGGGASYTSVYKLAEGVVHGMKQGKIGETYLLGGENMTMKEFAVLVKSLHTKQISRGILDLFPVLVIPERLSYVLAYFNFILNTQQARLGNSFHYINDTKARVELGYTHTKNDLEDAIVESF